MGSAMRGKRASATGARVSPGTEVPGTAEHWPEASAGDSHREELWEDAYLRFETPEQETRKFLKRLAKLGASRWRKDSRIVELFCGRGSGLRALHRFGFCNIAGVDLSARLLAGYEGPGRVAVADCRRLPFRDSSADIATIQGGLHHLRALPEDLEETLREAERVLSEGGLLIVVEPWRTAFLSLAHFLAQNPIAGRLSRKLQALGDMITYEGEIYKRWLAAPRIILDRLCASFQPRFYRFGWGKLLFVGQKVKKASPKGIPPL